MSNVEDDVAIESAKDTEVVMDEVAEARPVASHKSGTIRFFIILALFAGLLGASWYYQAMWFPQFKKGVQFTSIKAQQTQAWVTDVFASDADVDRLAAPMPMQTAEEMEDTTSATINLASENVPDNATQTKPENEALEVAAITVSDATEAADVVEETKQQAATDGVETIVETLQTTETKSVVTEVTDDKDSRAITEVVSDKVMGDKENLAAEVTTVSIPVVTSKSTVSLTDARQAFWQRQLPKAEVLYQQVTQSNVSADSWGELGNVYYLQAKWQLAASAYAEAALILLNKGDVPQAMFLRYIVAGLDVVQVKRIDERIRELQAAVQG